MERMSALRFLPLPLSLLSVLSVLVVGAAACSSSDKSGGPDNTQDTGAEAEASVPLGDPECTPLSLALSRPAPGLPAGKQSVWTLTSHSVLQSPDPGGKSSMLAQIVGGKIELDWLGTVDDGTDAQIYGGTLSFPGDDPAPSGAYCVLPGTVWHKSATGGKIDLVVTPGTTCDTTPPSDAGVGDGGAPDASGEGTVIMKACIKFN